MHSRLLGRDRYGYEGRVLTSSSLLLGTGAGVLHNIGRVQQGSVCGHALLLPPAKLAGMCFIGVTSQVMTCAHQGVLRSQVEPPWGRAPGGGTGRGSRLTVSQPDMVIAAKALLSSVQ